MSIRLMLVNIAEGVQVRTKPPLAAESFLGHAAPLIPLPPASQAAAIEQAFRATMELGTNSGAALRPPLDGILAGRPKALR